jgi:hypothetical protein
MKEHKIQIENFILREMAKLIRESDGEGESGMRAEAIQWKEDRTFDKVVSIDQWLDAPCWLDPLLQDRIQIETGG